ncbi:PA2169 family four-helix-bundle protein [Solitalea sp. MAHUQ-68]|uniref:PA2169 family four-helix-bundle protein n=1 Tax=Solitalea agri TaxID=2953739 RepID=A0A9X2JED7_9SPHI|nr:PA2169 family four-helix-bundle protein [Solitalea agri]MCO4294639.1 PA2169 family four-helix-bundle protein [Solitalea agri]
MENQNHVISALNDLLKVNNDRVQGYQKAIELTNDNELKKLFQKLALDSSKNINELSDHIFQINGHPAESTSVGGKFYRAWMDIKSLFTGGSRHQILSDCEHGEDMALDAYRKAEADKDILWDNATLNVLNMQKQRVIEGHNTIKQLRDQAA